MISAAAWLDWTERSGSARLARMASRSAASRTSTAAPAHVRLDRAAWPRSSSGTASASNGLTSRSFHSRRSTERPAEALRHRRRPRGPPHDVARDGHGRHGPRTKPSMPLGVRARGPNRLVKREQQGNGHGGFLRQHACQRTAEQRHGLTSGRRPPRPDQDCAEEPRTSPARRTIDADHATASVLTGNNANVTPATRRIRDRSHLVASTATRQALIAWTTRFIAWIAGQSPPAAKATCQNARGSGRACGQLSGIHAPLRAQRCRTKSSDRGPSHSVHAKAPSARTATAPRPSAGARDRTGSRAAACRRRPRRPRRPGRTRCRLDSK